jgi:hypothetical protein
MERQGKPDSVFDPGSILSADYFLAKCNKEWIRTSEEFTDALRASDTRSEEKNLFISGRDAINIFEVNNTLAQQNVNIFVHHTDVIPSASSFKKMSRFGYKLFSLNWMGDLTICKPIPIGIPSKIHSLNRNKSEFMKSLKKEILSPSEFEFFAYLSFDMTTNLRIRKPLLEKFYHSSSVFIPRTRLTPREHYSVISRSMYVFSPPGAGSDCFRTWEALYLGAIPVVFREHWPFAHEDLSIKVISDIEETLNLSDSTRVQKSSIQLQNQIVDLRLKFG